MFIETVPNRTSPPAVLLRESYRDEQGRAQKRTLANLSKLPGDVVEGLKALLKGGTVIGTGPEEMRIARSLPHGLRFCPCRQRRARRPPGSVPAGPAGEEHRDALLRPQETPDRLRLVRRLSGQAAPRADRSGPEPRS